ncbi:unnamed protein product [Protopolystoma xenopodis]|uniref:Uncharacterized protein n=1 Tax=Protopolystoma xenopodis TaxID=117903 RepID=A0A448WUI8_9PLAT|nr:unnamed protein product [Protopolystoma xenopodis]
MADITSFRTLAHLVRISDAYEQSAEPANAKSCTSFPLEEASNTCSPAIIPYSVGGSRQLLLEVPGEASLFTTPAVAVSATTKPVSPFTPSQSDSGSVSVTTQDESEIVDVGRPVSTTHPPPETGNTKA